MALVTSDAANDEVAIVGRAIQGENQRIRSAMATDEAGWNRAAAKPRQTAPGQFCTWTPVAGMRMGDHCPECGHAALVHIGTDHCPVCELVYQATPEFRRKQARIHGTAGRW